MADSMTLVGLFSFSIAMFILAITPGPGILVTVARALTSGAGSSVPVILGIICGDLLFVVAVLFGLSALASEFHWLYQFFVLFGSAYMVFLGWQLWRMAPSNPADFANELHAQPSWLTRFVTGLLTIFSEPKVVLFYIGFLPTFVSLSPLAWLDAALVVTIVGGVTFIVMFAYALVAERARYWLQSGQRQARLNRISALIMWLCVVYLLAGWQSV
ncbi:threonine transporter RhtB [Thiosulfatimonas sediminis]|uniref:Threonine transporter RhtB n=1 Tax=Thiosulfatimonas sediminis TaxID=2675054 RepID=A0A6F8PVQ3_9GAMM|nr:LysE family translocator [Thiosulfatimonas sediminis]BBP46084.1 threonine transporter RhtB [Thiosulfatimonas sediminis]